MVKYCHKMLVKMGESWRFCFEALKDLGQIGQTVKMEVEFAAKKCGQTKVWCKHFIPKVRAFGQENFVEDYISEFT